MHCRMVCRESDLMEVVAFVMGGKCFLVGYDPVDSTDFVGEGCSCEGRLIVHLCGNEHCDENVTWGQLPISWVVAGRYLCCLECPLMEEVHLV